MLAPWKGADSILIAVMSRIENSTSPDFANSGRNTWRVYSAMPSRSLRVDERTRIRIDATLRWFVKRRKRSNAKRDEHEGTEGSEAFEEIRSEERRVGKEGR